EPPAASAREKALRLASGSLKVRNPMGTRIVEILADSTDPKVAAAFVNTLSTEYIEQSLETRWKTTEHTGEWLTRQLQDLKIKLEKSEDQLQVYARATGLMFTGEKSSVAEERLRQVQQTLTTAQAERVNK